MIVITGETYFQPLDYLIVFLVAWKERPSEVTRMFSEWYSAIDKAAGRLGPSQRSDLPRQFQLQLQLQFQLQLQAHPQLQAQDPAVEIWEYISPTSEKGFSEVGLGCNPLRNTSYPPHGSPQGLIPGIRVDILLETLKVGFGLPTSITDQREWMFEIAFSSDDDEVIADAVSAWIVGDGHMSSGLCAPSRRAYGGEYTLLPQITDAEHTCHRANLEQGVRRVRVRDYPLTERPSCSCG